MQKPLFDQKTITPRLCGFFTNERTVFAGNAVGAYRFSRLLNILLKYWNYLSDSVYAY